MCSQLNCYKWMPARQLCFSRRGRYQAGSASRTTGALKAPASLYNWLNKGEVKRLPKLESLSDHTSLKKAAQLLSLITCLPSLPNQLSR